MRRRIDPMAAGGDVAAACMAAAGAADAAAAAAPGQPGGGLPFAGIPSELQAGVDQLLAEEPDHGEPDLVFTQPAAAERAAADACGG